VLLNLSFLYSMPSYSIARRAQTLTILQEGKPWPEITEKTGISKRQVQYYLAKAKERGYNPELCRFLDDEFLKDEPRSGRPRKLNEEQENTLV
jgi:transposase